jgi:hypothetical protein
MATESEIVVCRNVHVFLHLTKKKTQMHYITGHLNQLQFLNIPFFNVDWVFC